MAQIVIENGNLTIQPNGFSTANRYIREVANPANATMWMVEGSSIDVTYQVLGSASEWFFTWRLLIGPYNLLMVSTAQVTVRPSTTFNVSRPIAL